MKVCVLLDWIAIEHSVVYAGVWALEDVSQAKDVFGIKAAVLMTEAGSNAFLVDMVAKYTSKPELAGRVLAISSALAVKTASGPGT